ncbi:ATP-binding protein, partial [Streptomyces alkaliterrae]
PYAAEVAEAAAEEAVSGVGPYARRWLQVATPWGESYQSLLVLSQMPEKFTFPGSEYLAELDRLGFPVDWVARLKVVRGSEAESKAQRQAAELEHQYEEYAEDPIGPPPTLDKATAAIDDYRQELSDRTEVEVQAMVAMCVWGQTPGEADRRAAAVSAEFKDALYEISRPVGQQEELWYGMLPGARTPSVMVRHRQYLLSRGFAMAGPFATAQLGDERGPLFGLHTTSGGARPVLVDWARGPREEAASASAAFIGESGSGKTTAMKTAVYQILAGGRRAGQPRSRGRVVVVDRTAHMEWAAFTRACPGTTQVIEIGQDAQVSLDPLRIFSDVREARRYTQSFLTLLLGIAPRSEEGLALREAIGAVLQHRRPSLKVLLGELEQRGRRDAAARRAGRALGAFEDLDMSRALFDEALPPLAAGGADAIVFAVHALSLPTAQELEAGLEKVEDEKVFGRAAMYLIAAVSRSICFSSPSEFCVAVWDECWWLTSSPEGLELVLEMVRDGRKNLAAAFLASHDPEDIGPSDSRRGAIIRGLIPRKWLFRQPDLELARRGLAFLGLNPDDPDLQTTVMTQLSPVGLSPQERQARAGECLHRDLAGRISGMKVVTPPDAAIEPHLHSDPDAIVAAAA